MRCDEPDGFDVQRSDGAQWASLGAASVCVQGMRDRQTRFLFDGLPLFDTNVSGSRQTQIEDRDGNPIALFGTPKLPTRTESSFPSTSREAQQSA